MSSISLEHDRGIVLANFPHNDGRRIVKLFSRALGVVGLWVSEGKGKNRQVGKWHPGAILGFRGLSRKSSEGLIHFKEAQYEHLMNGVLADPRKSSLVFFLSEILLKVLPEESEHAALFDCYMTTLLQIEEENKLGWIHVRFLGQMIRILGIAPEKPDRPESHGILDLTNGDWKSEMGVELEHLPPSLARWFVEFCTEKVVSPVGLSPEERKRILLAQVRYLQHHLGGLKEIKSFEVLEAVFEGMDR